MLTPLQYVLIALAAVGAGAVNALAGGGTLITFPVLTALGVPAVTANVTNTVALCPGYFGAVLAQRDLIKAQKERLWVLLPTALAGGLLGGWLLLRTGEKLFSNLVPWLILLASLLLALGEPLKKWVGQKSPAGKENAKSAAAAVLPAGLAAVYGGYFGAGLSVIVLAVLGTFYDDSLTRLNALKQAFALATNVAAAVFFLFSGRVLWWTALGMAACALAGGFLGGKLSGSIHPGVLRAVVVGIGLTVSLIYFLR